MANPAQAGLERAPRLRAVRSCSLHVRSQAQPASWLCPRPPGSARRIRLSVGEDKKIHLISAIPPIAPRRIQSAPAETAGGVWAERDVAPRPDVPGFQAFERPASAPEFSAGSPSVAARPLRSVLNRDSAQGLQLFNHERHRAATTFHRELTPLRRARVSSAASAYTKTCADRALRNGMEVEMVLTIKVSLELDIFPTPISLSCGSVNGQVCGAVQNGEPEKGGPK